MPDFARIPADSAVQFAIDHDATTQANAGAQVNEVGHMPGVAQHVFAQCGSIRFILDLRDGLFY